MKDWDGNLSRDLALSCSAHRLAERDIFCSRSAAGVGANFLRATREFPCFLEFQFFRSRPAVDPSNGRSAVDEVN